MYIDLSLASQRTEEERLEGSLSYLQRFNRNGVTEANAIEKKSLDLYDLACAFFGIRTALATRHSDDPILWELNAEVKKAKVNLMIGYPTSFSQVVVETGFEAIDLLMRSRADASNAEAVQKRKEALATSHFLQNLLHNYFLEAQYDDLTTPPAQFSLNDWLHCEAQENCQKYYM
jgi:hypothetical protein